MSLRKERVKLTCDNCGIRFERLQCQLNKGQEKFYCSRACLGASKRHGSTLYCAFCDSPFYRRIGEQDVGVTVNQFCSRPCYKDWRVINSKPSTYLKDGARHIHRVVAEAVLGRTLLPDEVVHHGDLNKQNNQPSNLYVFPDHVTHMRCHYGKLSEQELRRFSLVKED